MSKHLVTVKEIADWADAEAWHEAAMSFGKGSSKKLEMSNARIFRVTDHKTVVYFGSDMAAAVDVYNAAP